MSRSTRLLVVGDTVLDADLSGTVTRVCPDAPVPVVDAGTTRHRPGAAGLAAVLAAERAPTTLVTGLSADPEGELLRRLLAEAGVDVVDVGGVAATPQKLRVRVDGQSLLRIDRGGPPGSGASGPPQLADEALAAMLDAIAWADGVLVADYGRGLAEHPALRHALGAHAAQRPLVWDPHPAGPAPVRGAWLVVPSEAEALRFAATAPTPRPVDGPPVSGGGRRGDGDVPADEQARSETNAPAHPAATARVAAAAELLRTQWTSRAVVVTCGARGAVLAGGSGAPLVVQPPFTSSGDPCGAGDCFASAALMALCQGRTSSEAVEDAVAEATRYVAEGGPPGPRPDPPSTPRRGVRSLHEATTAARAVQASGGTVVATSGCFDLLHPGHVHILGQAGRLGDLLVVLMNSDASVRRLKGPTRPIQPQRDRAEVLAALTVVDTVVVFEEDTPLAALRALRPDLFVKGGDYFGADLPEARLMADLGGRAVVVPYLAGRSTTRLVVEASRGS